MCGIVHYEKGGILAQPVGGLLVRPWRQRVHYPVGVECPARRRCDGSHRLVELALLRGFQSMPALAGALLVTRLTSAPLSMTIMSGSCGVAVHKRQKMVSMLGVAVHKRQKMVSMLGVEPRTYRSEVCRANPLRHTPDVADESQWMSGQM